VNYIVSLKKKYLSQAKLHKSSELVETAFVACLAHLDHKSKDIRFQELD